MPECAHRPPSATKNAPVTKEASSDARNKATLAISCGSLYLPMGMASLIRAKTLGRLSPGRFNGGVGIDASLLLSLGLRQCYNQRGEIGRHCQRHCQLNELALKKLPLTCRLSALRGVFLPLWARKPLVRALSFPLSRKSCALSVIS